MDLEAAKRADYMIANSQNTAQRIQKYYGRASSILYPGIEITPSHTNNEYPKIENKRDHTM
jgi:hypothetical protein